MATANQRTASSAFTSVTDVKELKGEQVQMLNRQFEENQASIKKMREMSASFTDAAKAKNVDQMRIIMADFATVSETASRGAQNLATKVAELEKGFENSELEIAALKAYDDEEQSMIDAAANLERDCAQGVENAISELAAAKNAFFMWRKKSVSTAQFALQKAEAEFAVAKAGVVTAKQNADQMKDLRLANASIEDTLQRIQESMERIIQRSQEYVDGTQQSIDETTQTRKDILESLKNYAIELEKGDEKIASLKAAIQLKAAEQDEVTATSSEWTQLESDKEALQNQLKDAEAERNLAFAAQQEGLRMIEVLRAEEQFHRTSLETLAIWIYLTSKRVETHSKVTRSHVIGVKSTAYQKNMSAVDKVVLETAEFLVEDAVTRAAALRNDLLESLGALPKQTSLLREFGEANKRSSDRFEAGLDDMRKLSKEIFSGKADERPSRQA